ncbi:hypothetical protein JCM8547_005742 [Rhodosporidiobolus lusitaniae]
MKHTMKPSSALDTLLAVADRAYSHPYYLPVSQRPALAADPLATFFIAAFTYLSFLSLSYLSLSPVPYNRRNRLLRLCLLLPALSGLSKLVLAHRAGMPEPFNESAFGLWGTIWAARACIMAFGSFGRAKRLRWVGWGWYTHREDGRAYWSTPAGQAESKRFNEAVLYGALPVSEPKDSPLWTPWKRLALAALFLASPRHLGFSTARPPSCYVCPPPGRKAAWFHFKRLLVTSIICDAFVLLYAFHTPFRTFYLDPSLPRPSMLDPVPPPYPNLPLPLRILLSTLAVGVIISLSISVFYSLLAFLSSLFFPTVPFPSLHLLNPFLLLSPLPSHRARAPDSVRLFWSSAWHDLIATDLSLFAFQPLRRFSRPLALVSAFAFSGLVHCNSLRAVNMGPADKASMAVFLLQGAAVAAETVFEWKAGRKVGGEAGRLWTMLCIGISGVIFTELYIARGFLGFVSPFSLPGQVMKATWWWPEKASPGPFE